MFNDKFYRQTFGLPMGSPLSPILADLVMQDLELVSQNYPTYVRKCFVQEIHVFTFKVIYTELKINN